MSNETNATSAGATWAMEDLELAKLHPNKWAVAIPNELIAVGDDADTVLAEASAKLGIPVDELVLTMIAAPETRINFWR
jgi:hypothetical protein